MAHRSKRRNATHIDTQDDLLDEIARPERVHSPAVQPTARLKRTEGLADQRRWDPRPELARDGVGRAARIVHNTPARKPVRARGMASPVRQNNFLTKPASFRFETGGKTIPICARRKVRKEVLHALKKTRSGKGSPKRRNQWSEIKCGAN